MEAFNWKERRAKVRKNTDRYAWGVGMVSTEPTKRTYKGSYPEFYECADDDASGRLRGGEKSESMIRLRYGSDHAADSGRSAAHGRI